jgi:hypothetical protein
VRARTEVDRKMGKALCRFSKPEWRHIMKKFILALLTSATLTAALSSGAHAQARPFSPGLRCGDVANLVSLNGARVISTGGGTYDRFVAAQRYCARGETTKPAWVLTADNPQCFVGYTCEPVFDRRR